MDVGQPFCSMDRPGIEEHKVVPGVPMGMFRHHFSGKGNVEGVPPPMPSKDLCVPRNSQPAP